MCEDQTPSSLQGKRKRTHSESLSMVNAAHMDHLLYLYVCLLRIVRSLNCRTMILFPQRELIDVLCVNQSQQDWARTMQSWRGSLSIQGGDYGQGSKTSPERVEPSSATPLLLSRFSDFWSTHRVQARDPFHLWNASYLSASPPFHLTYVSTHSTALIPQKRSRTCTSCRFFF